MHISSALKVFVGTWPANSATRFSAAHGRDARAGQDGVFDTRELLDETPAAGDDDGVVGDRPGRRQHDASTIFHAGRFARLKISERDQPAAQILFMITAKTGQFAHTGVLVARGTKSRRDSSPCLNKARSRGINVLARGWESHRQPHRSTGARGGATHGSEDATDRIGVGVACRSHRSRDIVRRCQQIAAGNAGKGDMQRVRQALVGMAVEQQARYSFRQTAMQIVT